MHTGFQITPEGIVLVRNGSNIYADTLTNFAMDYGQAAPAMIEGALQQLYEPGKRHFYADSDGVMGGGNMPWAWGDSVIAATDTLLTAKSAREYVEPTPVDTTIYTVTPRQFRLALNATGMRQSIEDYVALGTKDRKDAWEYATEIERNSPIIAAGAIQLGLTETQIDDLFTLAATL